MMATERETCVDELLRRQLLAEKLIDRFQEEAALHDDNLIGEARSVVANTQAFIDNNKPIIPSYCLKKVTDALRKLETHIDKPKKSNFQFKFKANHQTVGGASVGVPEKTQPGNNDDACGAPGPPVQVAGEAPLGFHDLTQQNLSLGKEEVRSKDVSLINLDQCQVEIIGPANTVYIRNLTQTTVTVFLACRAITVTNCRDCHFNLACQQLRIDSTLSSRFDIFTSARSMLESSKELEFAELKMDNLDCIKSDEIEELLMVASFNKSQNNWRCIDDFDWLSPNSQSKNFKLFAGP